MNKRHSIQSREAKGLTVIEVLFAMVIVLVGLVGIAAMIPFAIRQAEDSYKITQALAAGDNALGIFHSHSIVQPRLESPWLYVDDLGGRTATTSMAELYTGEYTRRIAAQSPTTAADYAVIQNETIGMGFSIDPMFWGYQSSITGSGNFSKTRFPFYNDIMPGDYNPLTPIGGAFVSTPRLRRVSLFDPNTDPADPYWLRQAPAAYMATANGGDLIQAKAENDKSAPPLRSEYIDSSGALMQSPTSNMSVSWMATLTPSDSTPVVTASMINITTVPGIRFLPEFYDLAVVVFSKRDVRDLNLDPVTGVMATGVVPVSERLGFLFDSTAQTPDSWNAGTFDISIESGANVDGKIKIGDWLMLSRNTSVEVAPSTFATRQRHKWYRVISVTGENAFPRSVRVAGEPWYWTEHELKYFSANGVSPLPTLPPTAVTLLKDVVQVYQRSVVIQTSN